LVRAAKQRVQPKWRVQKYLPAKQPSDSSGLALLPWWLRTGVGGAAGQIVRQLAVSTGLAVLNLQHQDSFALDNSKTHKNAAVADGFTLPVFFNMLLG
jgi:hypothetical protein